MSTSTGPSPDVLLIQAMITPALLILASGSLIATVLARIGRIVEMVRKIADSAKRTQGGLSDQERKLLFALARRAQLAEKAMIAYYTAVVCFVSTCLLIGINRFLNHVIFAAPVATAMVGVVLVLTGSAYMVAECRVAMSQLRREITDIGDQ